MAGTESIEFTWIGLDAANSIRFQAGSVDPVLFL
jgi:hypothetical protein